MNPQRVEYYSQSLSIWIEDTLKTNDPLAIKTLRSLWDDESWESIVKKYKYQGSTWYVWWMDGVKAYFVIDPLIDHKLHCVLD
jgi:hypothetical protein